MKALFALLALGSVMFAQTPAPAKAEGQPSAALLNPAGLKAQAPDQYKVKIATTKGDIVVEVHRDWAPRGADRFYNLVKNGFFDGAAFFRYVPNFIVQFGIPADPKVAAVWRGANIPDDPVKKINTNAKGTIVFATAGPNTRTTQLFINLNDNAPLDSQGFTAFGKVVEGFNLAEKLYSGYGESPDQGRIQTQGKPYLDKNFPKLDTIKSTTVLP